MVIWMTYLIALSACVDFICIAYPTSSNPNDRYSGAPFIVSKIYEIKRNNHTINISKHHMHTMLRVYVLFCQSQVFFLYARGIGLFFSLWQAFNHPIWFLSLSYQILYTLRVAGNYKIILFSSTLHFSILYTYTTQAFKNRQ